MGLLSRYDLYVLFVIGFIELARCLPFLPMDAMLARALAAAAYLVSHRKRALIQARLARVFGECPDFTARQTLIRRIFFEFWDEMLSWSRIDRDPTAHAVIHGMEHVKDALSRGRGVILWESNGFGKRVLAKATLHAYGINVTQLHTFTHLGGIGDGAESSSWTLRHIIHPYFARRELAVVGEILYLQQGTSLAFTRTLLDRLAHNAVLCIAAEGHVGHRHITIPFLGQPRAFATGVLSLSQLSGAPLLPLFCLPRANGGLALEIEPPVTSPPAPRQEQQLARLSYYVDLLETRIRAHPEWYRRWDLGTEA